MAKTVTMYDSARQSVDVSLLDLRKLYQEKDPTNQLEPLFDVVDQLFEMAISAAESLDRIAKALEDRNDG